MTTDPTSRILSDGRRMCKVHFKESTYLTGHSGNFNIEHPLIVQAVVLHLNLDTEFNSFIGDSCYEFEWLKGS